MARVRALRFGTVRPVRRVPLATRVSGAHEFLRGPHESGSASPLIVAVLAVVMVLAAALAQVGGGLVADAQASGVADLSALAAAHEDRDLRALGEGSAQSLEQACRVAGQVAGRNGAVVTACARGAGSSVVVSVSVPVPGWATSATARARAGSAWG